MKEYKAEQYVPAACDRILTTGISVEVIKHTYPKSLFI